MNNQVSSKKFALWFDPRKRQIGTLAFILNRITAIGLTIYLTMHLVALGQLAQGEQAYDSFVAMMHNPVFIVGELLVVAAGIIHGLNGIRIVLTSFGIGVRQQKTMFIVTMIIAIPVILFFAYRMFTV